MIKKIIISILVTVVIIFIFHIYKFIKHPTDDEINLDQYETYEYDNIENSINNKNIVVIRNYRNLNTQINENNLQKYEKQINFPNKNQLTINKILNKETKVYLERITFSQKLPVLRQFGSDLSIEHNIYITTGNSMETTLINCVPFNRTFIHVLKGKMNICLFTPNHKSKLQLKNKENTDFKESTLNQNEDSFKSIKDHQIEIVLREGNVLCLPNNWSFYNKYISDTLFLTYTFNTITSKVVNLFN